MEIFVLFCICMVGWPAAFLFWLYMLWAGRLLSRQDQSNLRGALVPLVGTIVSAFLLIDLWVYLIDDIVAMMERVAKERHFKKHSKPGTDSYSSSETC